MEKVKKEKYNIILTDLYGENPIKNAEEILDVKYLSITNLEPKFPVSGYITTELFHHLRLLINLICKFQYNPSVNIIFLIAPGKIFINRILKFKI